MGVIVVISRMKVRINGDEEERYSRGLFQGTFFLNYNSFIFSFPTIIHKRSTFISSRAIYQLLEPLLEGPEPPLVFN
jgi:hypothetical protein